MYENAMVTRMLSLSMGIMMLAGPVWRAPKKNIQDSPVANPENMMNTMSLRPMPRIFSCLRDTKTMIQDIARTTAVRMAVPRLESMSAIPTLPRMDVMAAKTAEPMANRSQLDPLSSISSTSFFSIIIIVPTSMSTTPTAPGIVRDSPRNTMASIMPRTVLDLSTGTTLFTLPICSALK